ncbi:hypothetical protein BC835DRAFT_1414008 [Cytidiella melzeri]|nr:hypothetical protein BC835DRAFT_1414008 [Cytidiella melzeri]
MLALQDRIGLVVPDRPKKVPRLTGGKRKTERRQSILNALVKLRYKLWLRDYRDCGWGSDTLLPDKTAAFLATNIGVRTTEDLKTHLSGWTCRERIGQAVLDHIKFVDDVWYETQGVVNPSARALETREETQARYNSNKRAKYSSQKPVPGTRILTYTAPSQSLKIHLAPSLPLAFDVTEAARPSTPLPCATPTAQPSMMPPSAMPFKFTSGHSPPKS